MLSLVLLLGLLPNGAATAPRGASAAEAEGVHPVVVRMTHPKRQRGRRRAAPRPRSGMPWEDDDTSDGPNLLQGVGRTFTASRLHPPAAVGAVLHEDVPGGHNPDHLYLLLHILLI
jgi:hypothetical protein